MSQLPPSHTRGFGSGAKFYSAGYIRLYRTFSGQDGLFIHSIQLLPSKASKLIED